MKVENFLIGTKVEIIGLTGELAYLNGQTGRVCKPSRTELNGGIVGVLLDTSKLDVDSKLLERTDDNVVLVFMRYDLTKDGLEFERSERIAKEGGSKYTVFVPTQSGLFGTINVSKSDLLIPMNGKVSTHEKITYYGWCLQEDEEECKEMLLYNITRQAEIIASSANAMLAQLKKNVGDA